MKKLLFTLAAMCLLTVSLFATTPPAAVVKAFQQKFPNATKVSWDKENAHEYEAAFTLDGLKQSANFSDTGEWLETETPITFGQLPVEVQTAFKAKHHEKVKMLARIEHANGSTDYEIEVKKGMKVTEYFYHADGSEVVKK